MSYVRLGDYQKQQQTAVTLFKLKSKNPYYFWAVMSLVMQAIHSDQKLAKGVILPLAERRVCILIHYCSTCIYRYTEICISLYINRCKNVNTIFFLCIRS